MKTILKQTTAIAALAALPIAALSAPAGADFIRKETGEYVERVPQATQQPTHASEDNVAQATDTRTPDAQATDAHTPDAQATGAQTTGAQATNAQATDAHGSDTDTQGPAAGAAGTGAEGTAADAATAQNSATEADGATDPATAEAMQGKDVGPGIGTGQTPAQQQVAGTAGTDSGDDVRVARVGETDIMRSEVLGVIGQLPPQLQQQPPEMLIPMALDQLVLRELILQEARAAGLDEDADVKEKEGDGSDLAVENAMVQVWLDRALADAVTEDRVGETYDTIRSQMGDQTPPLDAVRPQIEHELRRQAFAELAGNLQNGADVTLFGPDGQPMTR